jgi:hypothetical protein
MSVSRPFAIRLNEAERAELERQAGTMPLGTYVKSRIFSDQTKASKRAVRRPVADHAKLAQLLAMLGQSDIGARLDALAHAADHGTLVYDQATQEAIVSACAEVHAMHGLLMKALGYEVSS